MIARREESESINIIRRIKTTVQTIEDSPTFCLGSLPNLESLAIDTKKTHVQDIDNATNASTKISRPMHEITFSADDKPKHLSQASGFGGSNIDATAWEDKKCNGESRFHAQSQFT